MPDTPEDPTTPDAEVTPSTASLSVQAPIGSSFVFVSGGFSPPLDVESVIIGTEGAEGFVELVPALAHNQLGYFTANLPKPVPASELYLQVNTADDTSYYPTGVTIITGITDQPYATQVEVTEPGTTQLLRDDFYGVRGFKLYTATPTALPDGGTSLTYSDGTFFRGKDYFGFVDSYDSSGSIGQHTEYGRDGVNTTDVLGLGQTVHAVGYDTFNEYSGATKFIIGEGVGAETFNGFRVGGLNHDTVNLPDTDAGRLGQILAHATTNDLGTTLHLGHGDSLTFSDVSAGALRRNARDFTFT